MKSRRKRYLFMVYATSAGTIGIERFRSFWRNFKKKNATRYVSVFAHSWREAMNNERTYPVHASALNHHYLMRDEITNAAMQ